MNQNNKKSFAGVWTAIVTPFTQTLELNVDRFEKLIEKQIAAGITGIVVSGTTGEAPALSAQEKLTLIRKAFAVANGRIRIMAGTGGNNTTQSVELSKLAVDAGADSLLVVTPPYNKPSTRGLISHYEQIATIGAPVCLYHVPGRTGQHLTIEQISELSKIHNVDAVKEASGDIGFFARTVNASKLPVLSGDDPTYLASLAMGGSGLISVTSNLFPEDLVSIYHNHQNQQKLATDQQLKLLPLIDAMFCESNPGPIKAAMHSLGLCENNLRSPLAPVTEQNRTMIQSTVQSYLNTK